MTDRKVITPKFRTIYVPDGTTPEEEFQLVQMEDARPDTPKPPTHDGIGGYVSQKLEALAKGVRGVAAPDTPSAQQHPLARVGAAVTKNLAEIPAGLLDMLAHPVDNAPMLGATIATLPLGPTAGILRGAGTALMGNLAGQGVRSGYKAATGGGMPTAAGIPRGIMEAGRDTLTEAAARVFPALRRAAVKDESRALAAYVQPDDLLTRRTAQGELIPTLPGPGNTRTVTPALEDLAEQSLREVPGVRAMGRKATAFDMDKLLSQLRTSKTQALEAVASHEIPEARGKQSVAVLMERAAESGSAPRTQLKTLRKTTNDFFDRPTLERDEVGNLTMGADGLPLPVVIDAARNTGTFSPQQLDKMVQELGHDIAEAGAFGKNVPSAKINAWKGIRADLRDALVDLAPAVEALNLQMSRTKPLAGAFGAASYPSGPKVGMGELGAFSGNRLSAGVAASRRPNILSALARVENAVGRLPGPLQPRELTTLMRVLQQAYMPTETSHSK